MLLLATLAFADESGSVLTPATTFRVAVSIDAGGEKGPVWGWERVELGPCTGEFSDAMKQDDLRRWTWLSERDGLRIGVCGDEESVEVRLDGDATAPKVDHILLESGDRQIELQRGYGRWTGDPTTTVSQPRKLDFDPKAEARYREVRETREEVLQALEDVQIEQERRDLDDLDGWLLDDGDDTLMDGADWDIIWEGAESLEFDLGGF